MALIKLSAHHKIAGIGTAILLVVLFLVFATGAVSNNADSAKNEPASKAETSVTQSYEPETRDECIKTTESTIPTSTTASETEEATDAIEVVEENTVVEETTEVAVVTEETRLKMSQSLKQLYATPENCSRYGKFGADNPCSKKIKCAGLNREFIGIRAAAREMGIPSPNITRALGDPARFSAGKHDGKKLHWIYCEE